MEGLGNKLKLVRGTRSQEEFASILGVDRSTFASWEIDRREPDLATLIKISNLSGISLDWLSGRLIDKSFEQVQAYNDQKWHHLIDIAIKHKIPPEKLYKLINAALALR